MRQGQKYDKEEEEKQQGESWGKGRMNGPDTGSPVVTSRSGQGDTQLLRETIV